MAVVEVDISGEDIYRDAYDDGAVQPIVIEHDGDDEGHYPEQLWPPAGERWRA